MILIKSREHVVTHTCGETKSLNPILQILLDGHISKEGTLVNLIISGIGRKGNGVQCSSIGGCTTPVALLVLHREGI